MRSSCDASATNLRWLSLLHSLSAYHGYREHDNQLDPRSVLDFLFLSDRFARSVRFSVREVDRALSALQSSPGAPQEYDPKRASGRLCASLDYGTIDEILRFGLHEYIDDLQQRLNSLGNAVFETFVLYGDLTAVMPAGVIRTSNIGAWHAEQDLQMMQQQQQ